MTLIARAPSRGCAGAAAEVGTLATMAPEPHLDAPRRQARSIRNDAAIHDAVVALADADGWQGMSLQRIARAAGLARPSVLTRYRDRSQAAAGTWAARLDEPVREALAGVIDAADASSRTGDGNALGAAMRPFIDPGPDLRAAAEILLVGRYDPHVRTALEASFVPALDAWLTPVPGTLTPTSAAIRAYLCNVALGLLIETGRHPAAAWDFTREMDQMAHACANPNPDTSLPDAPAPHLDRVDNFDTGDPNLNNLLRAALEEIAARGYEAATIEVIARASGHTPGLVFSRYPSKRDLFLDATRRYQAIAADLNEAYRQAIAERTTLGIAEAITTRELMRPERRRVMTVTLETYRLSWHDPDLLAAIDAGYAGILAQLAAQDPTRTPAQVQAWLVTELARGNGPLVLAGLTDRAWDLPYHVLTQPLIDSYAVGRA